MLIDYGKIDRSVEFYEKEGFKRIEAPWWVPEQIMMLTAPKDHMGPDFLYKLEKNKKCLVASAEQSFLYMANQGLLAPGKYQAVSPCFRDEVQGPGRRKFFIKNELIATDKVEKTDLLDIIGLSMSFLAQEVPDKNLLETVKTEEGYDINYDGIEVGSYGIRENPILKWIYATGVAEPRLSYSISNSNYVRNNNGQ